MSNFQPSLVVDENLDTGWARVEVYGNESLGKLHMPRGRAVLGQLKCDTGSNQQAVDDREVTGGGGFRHRWNTLTDGTRIHVMTNDGHDTIRIYAPDFPSSQESQIDRRNDYKSDDYLWVGIRVKEGCRRPWYALDFALLEPAVATGGSGLVSSAFDTVAAWTASLSGGFTGDKGAYLLDSGHQDGANADAMVSAMYQIWFDPSSDFHFSSTMAQGDHNFLALCNDIEDVPSTNTHHSDTKVGFTRNGLFAMLWTDSSHLWGPFDPLMSDEQNAGSEHPLAGIVDTLFGQPDAHFGWDAVCWIDPFADRPEVSRHMGDKRAKTLALQKFMVDNEYTSKGSAQILDGTYKLVVRAFDTPNHQQSTRAGQYIGGAAGDFQGGPDSGLSDRSASCDYADYMKSVGTWPPLEVEVEVRIGRQSGTNRVGFPKVDDASDQAKDDYDLPGKVFKFDLVCQQYDDRESIAMPHGDGANYDDCLKDGGPNMGGPSFSDVIGIDIKGKTAEIIGGIALMSPFFASGPYNAFADQQRREVVFFIGTAFPVPSTQADWETLGGTALFIAAEAVTTGSYGCSDMQGEISEAEAQAMFSGTDPTRIWAWFPAAGHRLVDMGPPQGSSADWAAHDPPFDSTNFYWYYTLGLPYVNACKRPYGIVVTSVGGFYEMTTNWVGAAGFTDPDCCTS